MERFNESLSIMRKELRGYFTSPVAYIVITVFTVFSGFFFFKDFFYFNQAEMRSFFQFLPLMFCFVIPAVTMKLFAEERQTGSFEILMTLPVSTWHAVTGKFLAGFVFSAVMISPSLMYLVTVSLVGSPDFGPVIGGYIGALLLAGAYTSIGILASSITKNQIIAFIAAWAVCFLMWLVDKIAMFIPAKLSFISYLGTDYHFQNVARGIIDSRDVIYFVSLIALCMMITAKIIERRR